MVLKMKRFGRGLRRGLNKGRKFLGKTASRAKTILGTVDKLTGGMASKALSAHPYGMAAIAGLEAADIVGKI